MKLSEGTKFVAASFRNKKQQTAFTTIGLSVSLFLMLTTLFLVDSVAAAYVASTSRST